MRLTVIQIEALSLKTLGYRGDYDFWISQDLVSGQIKFTIHNVTYTIDRDGTVINRTTKQKG